MADGATRKPRRPRRAKAPTTPDAIEIAMEAEAGDSAADSPTRRLIARHAVLADADLRLRRWQIVSERAGVTLKGLTGLAGVLLLALAGWMAWQARQDRSLSILPIEAPPAFAERGLTGRVLAGQLQDRLLGMQRETVTRVAGVSVRDATSPPIMVDIPETAVSIAELQQLFDAWFSTRTTITGALSRVAGGKDDGALSLDIRVSGEPGVQLIQPDGDVGALLQRGAEHIYLAAAPRQYADWLGQHGREPEMRPALERATAQGTSEARAMAYVSLAEMAPWAEKASFLLTAVRLNPRDAQAWISLAGVETRSGHAGPASAHLSRAIREARRAGGEEGPEGLLFLIRGNLASGLGDWSGRQQLHCEDFQLRDCSGPALFQASLTRQPLSASVNEQRELIVVSLARMAALLHDTQTSARYLARPRPDLSARPAYEALVALQWMISEEQHHSARGDWPAALRASDQAAALRAQWPQMASRVTALPERVRILLPLGRIAEAEALIAPTPMDCDACLRARGQIAAQKGDAAGAHRWFAQAHRLTPGLPWAPYDWGVALFERGDFKGAVAKAKLATKASPRFADAIVLWGEALLAQGNPRGAARKFAQAAEYAPRWGRLHLKWAKALAAQGKTEEARAHRATAVRLDLTPAERAELNAWRL